jgi:hypothetical protein
MVQLRTASFWLWYNIELLPHPFVQDTYDLDSGRLTDEFSSLLNIAHVRYLLSPLPVRNENLALLWDGDIKLYENRTALPRAYLVCHWYGARNIEEAATWLFDSRHNRIPAIEEDSSVGPDSAGAISEVTCSAVTPQRIEFEIRPETESYLVFTDSYDPGWKAEIDGVPAKIQHVNGYQQGVKVNATARKAVFLYRPEGFYRGGIISGVSLMALIIWITKCLRHLRAFPAPMKINGGTNSVAAQTGHRLRAAGRKIRRRRMCGS